MQYPLATRPRGRVAAWPALLATVALCLLASAAPVRAQFCEYASLTVTRPANNAANLSGTIRVDITSEPPPQGWTDIWVEVYDNANALIHQGYATRINASEAFYEWDTSDHINQLGLKIQAVGWYGDDQCTYTSNRIGNVSIYNWNWTRHAAKRKLQELASGSSVDPLTGNTGAAIAVSAWEYKGASYPFALFHDSVKLADPQAAATPEFAGLGDGVSRFSHSMAMWVDMWEDESGQEYAVWHTGSGAVLCKKAASGTSFEFPESNGSITYGGGPITSPPFPYDYGTATLQVDYGWFIIETSDGTKYEFAYQPPSGASHVHWRTSEGSAFPHYLLTRIRDRWGRVLSFTWSGGDEPRVTSVKDNGNTGLTFNYTGNLLTSVLDAQGRTHTMSYTAVPDENGVNRQRLTGVTVYGAGSPTRTTSTWSFLYRDAANPTLAYGGSYSGDQVIRQTLPDGRSVDYRYESIALVGVNKRRPREGDWEGRLARISWTDSSEGTAVERVITRAKEGAQSALWTYPGNVSVRYGFASYNTLMPSSVEDVSTGRVWSWTYDSKQNLLQVRTPLERTTTSPLINHGYTFDLADRIDQVTTHVRGPGDTLVNPVETQFNDRNLPTQVKAYAAAGSGLPDQVTQLQYDGGTLSVGNLTKVIEAAGTALQQETNLFYHVPDGSWGLVTRVQNEAGGVSSMDYHDDRGWPLSSSSPQNLVVPSTHPDRPASTSSTSYNADGLPSVLTDPLGHQVSVSYQAQSAGSANLVVTYTFGDGSTQQVLLDPFGKVLEAKDERGVITRWTYNPQGEVKTIRQAAGTADERLTTFSYDDRGDMVWFDPPKGSAHRVNFEYGRYNQDGSANGTYEGQVTRIRYPDSTSEYFGYNGAGELAWRRKADGTVITLTRDEQHRVTRIDYPASQGNAAFSVTAAYDEFGRVTSTTDSTGTTSVSYDVLDRITALTPPTPQKALNFSYSRDTTLQRWTSNVTVAGVGTYTHREDSKGRPSETTNPFNQTWRAEYDKDGKQTLKVHPNGVQEESTYTARDWLASILHRKADGTVLDTLNYYYTDGAGVYDPTGHLRREVDGGGRTHAYSYNNLYELTSESHPDLGTVTYSYDGNGNRTSRNQDGVLDYYGVDANNKLLWVNRGTNAAPTSGQANPYTLFGYDLNGRMTRRERKYNSTLTRVYDFLWDGDDRLKQVKEGVDSRLTASYDGGGLRVSKWDFWTGQHDFSWGPGGVLHDSSGSTTYTPGAAHRSNNVDRFYHTDWIGSSRYLSDSSGNNFPSALRYDAFGQRSATSGPDHPTDFLFAGAYCSYYTSV